MGVVCADCAAAHGARPKGLKMTNRKLVAAVSLCLAVGASASGVALAAKNAAVPRKVTVTAIQKNKVVPNRYFQDGLRWDRDVYRVKSGGTITVLNNAAGEGAHTLTVVKEKDLPRTVKAVFTCKICNKLFLAHGADPNTGGPPKFQYLENGVGQNTPPNLDRPGDSGLTDATGQGKKGEKISFKVTAKKGKELYFMCIIHPWMQAKVLVQ